MSSKTRSEDPLDHQDPDDQIMVTTSYGFFFGATSKDILACPGLSCAARGVALLAQGYGEMPAARTIAELTGEPIVMIQHWIDELASTDYLEVEEEEF